MPRKASVVEEDEGPDKSWMESYADAMTLLLAFFIMMFAFALVDETKFADFKVGMVTAIGVSDPIQEQADSLLESGNGIALTLGLSTVPTEDLRNQITKGEGELEALGSVSVENVEEVKDLLTAKFLETGAAPFVSVTIDERGVVVRYDGRVLFESGSADLGVDSDAVLVATAEVLQLIDNPVDIEGHTDDVPTGGRWISNWELSSARASAVVRWLIDYGRMPPRQLAAVGMAFTRPVVPNDSDVNRATNRRVEIVVRVDGLLNSDIDVVSGLDPISGSITDVGDTNDAATGGADSDAIGDPIQTGLVGPVTEPGDADGESGQ